MKTSVKIALHLAGLCGVAATVPETCTGSECKAAYDEAALLQKVEIRKHDASAYSYSSAEPVALQVVAAFTQYVVCTGDLETQGTVSVKGLGLLESAEQVLSWKLSGVDPECSKPHTAKNACGIHIHQGKSCYEDAGGHYWNTTLIETDPWLSITYKAEKHGQEYVATAQDVKVVTGLTNFEVLSHTMVIHNSIGGRVACGIITPRDLGVMAFTPYYTYTGDLHVGGMGVKITAGGMTESASQTLMWNLNGVDPKCREGASKEFPNSCGIHIHQGMSCGDNALGHYWNKTTYEMDPWANVGYPVSYGTQTWDKAREVTTGLEATDVMGHTMIVHNYTGGRIACGIIAPCTEIVNAFVPYYNYQGDLQVSGFVKVVGAGILSTASQTLSWRLSNVDPTCVTPPAAGADPNACGIHIHEGMSCTENAGDHFYNKALVSTDPWHAVKYLAVEGSSGVWSASGDNAKVITGLSDTAVLGHTMVVHNSAGGRIACSIVA
mmetsp:Transcript_111727/g.301365  ORF Transcript_111727/g.301365 Transcript_111727/m.301365 type:complete len:494 (-) Transcript_111727:12-1493(-)